MFRKVFFFFPHLYQTHILTDKKLLKKKKNKTQTAQTSLLLCKFSRQMLCEVQFSNMIKTMLKI